MREVEIEVKRLIYFVLYYTGLWLIVRFFNRKNLAILMYHGVTDKDYNVWTQLPRSQFQEQMEYISRRYRPVCLEDAVTSLKKEKSERPYAVAVTFDDGFRNNFSVAFPILKKHNIPALIFLTTSFVDKEPEFRGLLWTDYIYLLLRGARGNKVDFGDLGLKEYDLSDYDACAKAKSDIMTRLKTIPAGEKNRIVQDMARRLNYAIKPEDYVVFESLEWNEAKEMLTSQLVTFGAHTVRHEILTRLTTEEAEKEMRLSKELIESRLGVPVTAFAYPNGKRDDFDDSTEALAAKHFDCAVSTVEGLNDRNQDLYALRRINIGNDIDLLEFKMHLSGVYEFLQMLLNRNGQAQSVNKRGY